MNMKASDNPDKIYDPICEEIAKSLEAIHAFQRNFFPPDLASIQGDLVPFKDSLDQTIKEFKKKSASSEQAEDTDALDKAITLIGDTLDIILNASATNFQNTLIQVMKAFRKICRAQEHLYTIRHISRHLNRFFLEPAVNYQMELLDPDRNAGVQTGLIHQGVENTYYARGAISMYVPESYDGSKPWPLVVALHGGYGHGRDFIWSWIREARSRKFLLLAPTSLDTTWSLLQPALDGTALYNTLDSIAGRWLIDPKRMLLTGISDGGTFALVCAMQKDSPFTAFAPVACTLPPMDISHAKGKRILWIHGALDWMFPADTARGGSEMLNMAGADITLHMMNDLSHTYPRDENDRILHWFDPSLDLPGIHSV